MKKTLIISFTFPPFPGIGGRRWAKFAKYLYKHGVETKVLAARKRMGAEPNPWEEDIKLYRKNVKYFHTPYPLVLSIIPKTLIQKIHYKIALKYVKLRYGKGNYFDPSNGFTEYIKDDIKAAIKNQGYKNIIVSCGPFRMAAEIIDLKKEFKDVNFMVDFRDPWANNKTSFGFLTISDKQREYELSLQKKVIDNYDKVISVSDEMNGYFKTLGDYPGNKFVTIENGFDPDDFVEETRESQFRREKLKFVFTGTLYGKTQHIFKEWVSALKAIKKDSKGIYDQMEFHFYGHVPDWFYPTLKPIAGCVVYHGEVGLKEVYRAISSANICMLFLTDDLTYSRSTKFYEYLSQKKPIAVFSAGGGTGEFVESRGIGYAIDSKNMKAGILKAYSDWSEKKMDVVDFDVSAFNIENLCHKLEGLLKN